MKTRKEPETLRRACQECGKVFTARDPERRAKWCSGKCKMKNYWRRRLAKEVA
jgi:endogenous inhibitor of DNA gyrase (YacG/DUF329 family)